MKHALPTLAVVFAIGCSGSPTAPTPPPTVVTPPPVVVVPPPVTYAPRPICTSAFLPKRTDVRVVRDATARIGGTDPASTEFVGGYRFADGVWNTTVEWAGETMPTITFRTFDNQRQIPGAQIVRTGPTTVTACWDGGPDEGYRATVSAPTGVSQSIRVTWYQPAASACGPIACTELAPPGW